MRPPQAQGAEHLTGSATAQAGLEVYENYVYEPATPGDVRRTPNPVCARAPSSPGRNRHRSTIFQRGWEWN